MCGLIVTTLVAACAASPTAAFPKAGASSSPTSPTPAAAAPAPRAPAITAPAATPSGKAPAAAVPSSAAARGSALAAADRLTVKGRAPLTGYSRAQFGPAWADVDHNGCDTRNDVLRRDLRRIALRPGTHGCIVLGGVLLDPYTGATIAFVRGVGTSSRVQIDHVVALADAWQKGAQRWTAARRLAFANDPLNLLAVSGKANQQKGAGDAATWLPPRRAYRCAYVARQVAVKTRYGVWVTAAERAAMLRVLTSCPDQPLPR